MVIFAPVAAVPSNLIESWYHADSFNLLVNNGAAAGQVIFHVSFCYFFLLECYSLNVGIYQLLRNWQKNWETDSFTRTE